MQRHWNSIGLLAFALLALGCQGKEPPHLSWSADPEALENPFPDARLFGSDGGYSFRDRWWSPFLPPRAQTPAAIQTLRAWGDAGSEIAGVGNFTPTLLPVSEPVDPATLAGTAYRLAESDGGWQVLESGVAIEHSTDALSGSGLDAGADFPEFIAVRPSVPLPEGADGLLVIATGIKTRDGAPLGRGFAFENASGSAAAIASAAKALGRKPAEILLALPQHGGPVRAPLLALAQWTTAHAPAFTIPAHGMANAPDGSGQIPVGVWKPTDADWYVLQPWLQKWSFAGSAPHVGQVVIGTFQAKDARDASGVWTSATPDGAQDVSLYFVLSLPAGAKPTGGYPVVIGGHGINARNVPEVGGSNAFCLEVAEVLAQTGLGCLGIDATSHGTRGSSINFFNLDSLAVIRDNFREMIFDQMQLSRLSQVLDLDGDGTPDLSSRLGYFGNSLGSIMGANFISVDPRVGYGVLNVGGGGLGNVMTSPGVRDLLGLLLSSEWNVPYQSEAYYGMFPLLRTAGQLFIEPGDPVNVGLEFPGSGKAVLLQVGKGDQTIPNFTSDALAAAMQLPSLTAPLTGQAPVRAYFQLDPAKYGEPSGYNGHNIFWDIAAARAQVQAFLGSGGTQVPLE